MREGDDIRALLEEASTAWPDVEVDIDGLMQHLSELQEEAISVATLEPLHLGELCLAFACLAGDRRALELFEQHFRGVIRHAASHAAPGSLVDEVVQQVFTKLLVAEEGKRPALAAYGGRAKLSTWLQVVSRREARTRVRWEARHGGASPTEDEVLDRLMARASPREVELASLKSSYRAQFKEAFRRAFESLSARERNMLRYECIDGLTRDEIGRIYNVSRPTVARWRAACRQRLHEQTQRYFTEQAKIDDAEFAGALEMISSHLHVSLCRLLGEPDE